MRPPLPCQIHDPEIWFPVGYSGPAVLQAELAKMYCHSCPIEAECLAAALSRGESAGVWGGATEEERRVMLSRRTIRRTSEDQTGHVALNRALASS